MKQAKNLDTHVSKRLATCECISVSHILAPCMASGRHNTADAHVSRRSHV